MNQNKESDKRILADLHAVIQRWNLETFCKIFHIDVWIRTITLIFRLCLIAFRWFYKIWILSLWRRNPNLQFISIMWRWYGKNVCKRVYGNSFVVSKTLCFQISWMSHTEKRTKSWMSTFIMRKKLLNCVSILKNINWFISMYIAYCFQNM